MSNHNRTCEFSSELFGGFRCKVNIRNTESLDEIIILAVSQLRIVLETFGFDRLVEKIDKLKWHIHSLSLNDIISKKDEVIWICDHD